MEHFISSIITMFFFFGAVLAAVVPTVASPIAAVSVPRSEPLCAPLGVSTATEPSNKTLTAFTHGQKYDQLALNASTPVGYAPIIKNANCAFSSTRYMLYVQLDSYSPESCAQICNEYEGCDSSRPFPDPGPACPNPDPIFVTKCALYSLPEKASACTNFGQHIGPADANGEAFKIAIRSSNAYNKVSRKQITVVHTTTHHMHKIVTRTVTQHEHHKRAVTVTVPISTPYPNHKTTHKASSTAVPAVNGGQVANLTTTITIHRASETKPVAVGTPAGTITVTRSANPTAIPGTTTITRTRTPSAKGTTITVTRPKSTILTTVYQTRSSGVQPSQPQYVSTTTITSYYDKRAVLGGSIAKVRVSIARTADWATVKWTERGVAETVTTATSVEGRATAEPMSTLTLDENYVYTGPTDVPMKTITIS